MLPGSQSRTIPAGEFKAKCLKLMDEINETGEQIVITKRGKPVSRLVPAGYEPRGIRGRYEGLLPAVTDPTEGAYTGEEWERLMEDQEESRRLWFAGGPSDQVSP